MDADVFRSLCWDTWGQVGFMYTPRPARPRMSEVGFLRTSPAEAGA